MIEIDDYNILKTSITKALSFRKNLKGQYLWNTHHENVTNYADIPVLIPVKMLWNEMERKSQKRKKDDKYSNKNIANQAKNKNER